MSKFIPYLPVIVLPPSQYSKTSNNLLLDKFTPRDSCSQVSFCVSDVESIGMFIEARFSLFPSCIASNIEACMEFLIWDSLCDNEIIRSITLSNADLSPKESSEPDLIRLSNILRFNPVDSVDSQRCSID